jgi:hypothetical protein
VIGRDLLIVACAISAGIHAALAPAHFAEGTTAGAAFVAAAGALGALAVLVTKRPTPPVLGAATLVLAGLLASYALAITTGLPLLHREPEAVEPLAVFTKAVESLGLLAALDLLRRGRTSPLPHLRPRGSLT